MTELGESDVPLKITFVVTKKQDPQVHKWLQNHQFKNTSAAVRALLNIGAAAMVAVADANGTDPMTKQGMQAKPRKVPKKLPVTDQRSIYSEPAVLNLPPQAQLDQGASRMPAAQQMPRPVVYMPASPSEMHTSLVSNESPQISTEDMNGALDALSMFDRKF